MCYNIVMNTFYEAYRDDFQGVYVNKDKDAIFPSHYHASLEIFILKKGFYTITINGVNYNVSGGSVVVFDSYEVHSYDFKGTKFNDNTVLILPFEFRNFLFPGSKMKINCPIICDGVFAGKLSSLIDEYVLDKPYSIQSGALSLICSLLKEKLTFICDSGVEDTVLLRKILTYISENFKADVSRSKIASELGYTESYVSHVFHRYLKVNINEYVNKLRLSYLNSQIAITGLPASKLLYDAGFKSEQTYYRVKKRYDK